MGSTGSLTDDERKVRNIFYVIIIMLCIAVFYVLVSVFNICFIDVIVYLIRKFLEIEVLMAELTKNFLQMPHRYLYHKSITICLSLPQNFGCLDESLCEYRLDLNIQSREI